MRGGMGEPTSCQARGEGPTYPDCAYRAPCNRVPYSGPVATGPLYAGPLRAGVEADNTNDIGNFGGRAR